MKRWVLHTFYSDGSDGGGDVMDYAFDEPEMEVAIRVIDAVGPLKQWEFKQITVHERLNADD